MQSTVVPDVRPVHAPELETVERHVEVVGLRNRKEGHICQCGQRALAGELLASSPSRASKRWFGESPLTSAAGKQCAADPSGAAITRSTTGEDMTTTEKVTF